jgi:hypothetical protein
MYQVPNFLVDVQDFRCINTSNRKLLKPAIDLATRVQQESLTYLLDIFPGLYCQRVTTGACPPVSTISQPVLLVAFDSSQGQARTQPEIGQNDAHLQYEMEENSQPTQLEGITIHPYSQHVRNENNQPFQPETETNHPSERDGRNEKNQYPIPGSSTNHPNVQCERNKTIHPHRPGVTIVMIRHSVQTTGVLVTSKPTAQTSVTQDQQAEIRSNRRLVQI